ncbi:MAG: hypothetical protein ABW199_04180 [Caulobacterales bacterium]
MRPMLAAAALGALTLLTACATAPSGPATGGWSYGYDASAGLATATLREPSGQVTTTFTCRPPSGDLVITDRTLRGGSATIQIGAFSTRADARGGSPLTLAFPQSPPLLAAARGGEEMSITAGGGTHRLAPGAAQKLREVADACWPQGS